MSDSAPTKPWWMSRRVMALVLALSFVLAARILLYLWLPVQVGDFDLLYAAAVRLIQGESPYPPGSQLLPYPLPAVVLVAPFTLIPLSLARLSFDVLVGWAFVFALWKYRGMYALLALLSGSYLFAMVHGQTTPLMVAAGLVPALGLLLAVRPNASLAVLAARPSWKALIGMVAFLALTVALAPTWPRDWWMALPVSDSPWVPPLLRPFGPLLLLAALRWNQPEGRLLLATALLPQTTLPYELVLLAIIPANPREMVIYLVGSWISVAAATGVLPFTGGAGWMAHGWPVTLCAGYLPMLYMVLRRPGRKGGPWIGKERRRAHRLPDDDLEVVCVEEGGQFTVSITHLPSQQTVTQTGATRQLAVRKAHDQLAAVLARASRLVRKDVA